MIDRDSLPGESSSTANLRTRGITLSPACTVQGWREDTILTAIAFCICSVFEGRSIHKICLGASMWQIAVRNGRPIVRLCNAKGVSWSSKSPTLTAIGDEKKKNIYNRGCRKRFRSRKIKIFQRRFHQFLKNKHQKLARIFFDFRSEY